MLEKGDFETLDGLLAPEDWSCPRSTSFAFIADGAHLADLHRARGTDLLPWSPPLQLRANSGWRTVSQSFAPLPDARFLKIIPELMQARGLLDMDDIQVEHLP